MEKAVQVQSMTPLDKQRGKLHGMTHTIEITFTENDGSSGTCYLKLPEHSLFGERLGSDAVKEITWRLEGYPTILGHSLCIGAGGVTAQGDPVPLSMLFPAYFSIEQALPGTIYADKLQNFSEHTSRTEALRDVQSICAHMVRMHKPVERNGTALYRRMLREKLMDPVFRLIDADEHYWSQRPAARMEVEHLFLGWRQRLWNLGRRIRVVHNDFHPWNILIKSDGVALLGARSPGVGEPANDLAALMVNYVWFSYLTSNKFEGLYRDAYLAFWNTYLEMTGDIECLAALPPFLANRLLLFLDSAFYPGTGDAVKARVERLLFGLLKEEIHPIDDVNEF